MTEAPAIDELCRRCGAEMRPGIAMAQTYASSGDDIGGVCTVSPGGPGKLIGCSKCSTCGWSVSTNKRFATLQAQAAMRGVQVDADGSGGFVVRMQGHPWERAAPDLEALARLLGRMGVRN